MTEYLIRCAYTEHPHRHIVSVQAQRLVGDHYEAVITLTVGQVLAKMVEGETFNTYSPSTDQVAGVRKDACGVGSCRFETIRSTPDAVADNNLDNLAC